MYYNFKISDKVLSASEKAMEKAVASFANIDKITEQNQVKVLSAFTEFGISESHFAGSTGYGYGDRGRETIDKLFAKCMGAEDSIIRHNSASLSGIYEDGKLISAAFSLFETENSAVISSVATLESHRNKGYATEIINALLSKNSDKSVYVFTENENIDKWYKKIGFTEHKKWSEIKNVL